MPRGPLIVQDRGLFFTLTPLLLQLRSRKRETALEKERGKCFQMLPRTRCVFSSVKLFSQGRITVFFQFNKSTSYKPLFQGTNGSVIRVNNHCLSHPTVSSSVLLTFICFFLSTKIKIVLFITFEALKNPSQRNVQRTLVLQLLVNSHVFTICRTWQYCAAQAC